MFAALALVALALTACGGGGGGTAAGGAQSQRRGFQLSDKQIACLRQHGLDFPQSGGRKRFQQQFAQRRRKMAAAFAACGIRLPQRRLGGFGPPGGTPAPGSTQQ